MKRKSLFFLLLFLVGCSIVNSEKTEIENEEVKEVFIPETIVGDWDWTKTFFGNTKTTLTPESQKYSMTLTVKDSISADWFKDDEILWTYVLQSLKNDPYPGRYYMYKVENDIVNEYPDRIIQGINDSTGVLVIYDLCNDCGVYDFKPKL